MNLKYMEYFVKAIDRGNISAAAEELFLTPQGLSQALHKVEKEYGATLFFRDGNGIRPTRVGDVLYEAFESILSTNNSAKETCELEDNSAAGPGDGRITVFVPTILAATVLPGVVPLYCKKNPRVRLRIIEIPSRESYNVEESPGNMICLFGTTPSNVGMFSKRFPELTIRRPLYRTNLLAYVSKKSRLAYKTTLTSEDFAERDIVLCRNEEYFLKKVYPNYSDSNIIIRSQNKRLCFSVVEENKNTIGFTNGAELYYCMNPNLVQIPIYPYSEIVYGYLVNSDYSANPHLTNFTELIEAEFRKISASDEAWSTASRR